MYLNVIDRNDLSPKITEAENSVKFTEHIAKKYIYLLKHAYVVVQYRLNHS